MARQQQQQRQWRLGVRRVWQVGMKARFTGAVLTALLAAFRYWERQSKQRSMGHQFPAFPGVYARSRGSRPCWGPSASSSARAGGPIQRACRTGWGTSSRGNSVDEPKTFLISLNPLATRVPELPVHEAVSARSNGGLRRRMSLPETKVELPDLRTWAE